MQALILAGGLGTRLRRVLPELPKPLAPIGDKPFLLYILEQLKKYDIRDIVLSVGYRADMIEDVFGDGSGIGMKLQYAREEKPLGTGGALRNALPLLSEDSFLLMNGDTYFDINFITLEKYHRYWDADVTIALHYRQEVERYGIVQLSGEKNQIKTVEDRFKYRIDAFHERMDQSGLDGFINGGIYLVNKRILKDTLPTPSSIERDIMPVWVKSGSVYGLPFSGRFIDIGVPEDYRIALEEIDDWTKSLKYPALFLDRDGVINEDLGYLWRSDDIRFIPRTIELIRLANGQGWKVIVVTNQAGVARGYYHEEDVQRLHRWMTEELDKVGAHIDCFFYCPHHPEGLVKKFRKKCFCRKPMPGMILQAAQLLNIDLERSFMIGDKETDRIQLSYLKSVIIDQSLSSSQVDTKFH